MTDNTEGCGAAIGSITQAMGAQRALAEAAIPSAVIKFESLGKGSRGCIYGVSFSCSQLNNAKTVLSHKGVRVKQWNGRT